MEITFLPYGMVVYSHEMEWQSADCLVATRGVLGRSVEAKLSFMSLGSAVSSDRLVLAAKRKTLRQPTSCTHQSVRHKLAWSLHPFRINGRSD